MNVKEFGFNAIVAGIGLIVTAWLGGWDLALKWLIALMIADYLTGFFSAWKQKQLNSEVMFWGGIRKAAILVVIALGVMLDQLLGNQEPVFRTMAVYFYIAREVLSIIENLGLLGVYVPPFIKQALEQLQKKGESA